MPVNLYIYHNLLLFLLWCKPLSGSNELHDEIIVLLSRGMEETLISCSWVILKSTVLLLNCKPYSLLRQKTFLLQIDRSTMEAAGPHSLKGQWAPTGSLSSTAKWALGLLSGNCGQMQTSSCWHVVKAVSTLDRWIRMFKLHMNMFHHDYMPRLAVSLTGRSVSQLYLYGGLR